MYDSTELGVDLEEDRRRVHLALLSPSVEGEALRECEKTGRGLVTEAARAEVDADPDLALLVLHQVDVVVARADRAQLRCGRLRQLPLRGELGVPNLVQHRMVDLLGRRNAHAERDPPRDLAHELLHAAESVEVGARQVGACRLVATADVVADARRRHVPLVGDAAADRLRVTRVMVGAEHAELGVARLHASLELLQAPLVDVAECLDLHLVPPFHCPALETPGGFEPPSTRVADACLPLGHGVVRSPREDSNLCARGRNPVLCSAELRGQVLLEGSEVLVREEDEADLLDLRVLGELVARRSKRDLGGSLDRVAVDAGRDRGERHGAATELLGDLERAPVTGGEAARPRPGRRPARPGRPCG